LAPEQAEERATAAAPAPSTGREYLRRSLKMREERTRARGDRQRELGRVHQEFAARAKATVLSPPQDPALSGRSEPMLLNAAYLAPRADGAWMAALAARWRTRTRSLGFLLELTGPWPPYHFASSGAHG
jgi:hypothetical protein